MKKGSSLIRGSLCPHYSKGLVVRGTREVGPTWCSVINLPLSDLTALAKRKETLPGFQIHKHTQGRGQVLGTEVPREGLVMGEHCNQIIPSKKMMKFHVVSVAPHADRCVESKP